jgi:hypothetical protein
VVSLVVVEPPPSVPLDSVVDVLSGSTHHLLDVAVGADHQPQAGHEAAGEPES